METIRETFRRAVAEMVRSNRKPMTEDEKREVMECVRAFLDAGHRSKDFRWAVRGLVDRLHELSEHGKKRPDAMLRLMYDRFGNKRTCMWGISEEDIAKAYGNFAKPSIPKEDREKHMEVMISMTLASIESSTYNGSYEGTEPPPPDPFLVRLARDEGFDYP